MSVVIDRIGAGLAPVIGVVVGQLVGDRRRGFQFQAHVHLIPVTGLQTVSRPEIDGLPGERHLAFTDNQPVMIAQAKTNPGLVQRERRACGVIGRIRETTGADTKLSGVTPRLVFVIRLAIGIENQCLVSEVAEGVLITWIIDHVAIIGPDTCAECRLCCHGCTGHGCQSSNQHSSLIFHSPLSLCCYSAPATGGKHTRQRFQRVTIMPLDGARCLHPI